MSQDRKQFIDSVIATVGSTVVDGRLYVSADDFLAYMNSILMDVMATAKRGEVCSDALVTANSMTRATFIVFSALAEAHTIEVPDHIPDDIIE